MNIDLSGRHVLLDGCGHDTPAQIHELLREGARVTVAAADYPTSVRDLAERELIEVVPADPDRSGFDVVISADTEPHEPETRTTGSSTPGTVTLVGGGPGDPGLLTVAGLAALRAADVVVHDRLAPLESLREAAGATLIDVGKIPRGEFTPQERINAVLVEHAHAGRAVVRLKGGDSFVFGRGGEEVLACAEAGIAVRVIPGVTSAVAAPELAGIPVTHRSLTQGFTVISGHAGPGDPRSTLDWAALARANTTLVILMGVATLPAITEALLEHGMDPDTPAAGIADAGMASMQTARGTVATIAADSVAAGIGAPAVTVIGAVAGLDLGDWGL